MKLNYLSIPIEESVKNQYLTDNLKLFDGNNLIIDVLPESYRVVSRGIDYELFEGLTSSAVLVNKSSYKFSVTTHSTSNDLGLILNGLVDDIFGVQGQINPLTVNDYLSEDVKTRLCLMTFQAVAGSVTLLKGTKAKPGGYQIEFTEIS